MKYNLDFTEGCTAFSYLINGVEFVDFNDNKTLQLIINELIRQETNAKDLFYQIIEILGTVEIDPDYFEYSVEKYKFDEAGLWDYVLKSLKEECFNDFENWEEKEEELNIFLNSLSEDSINKIKGYLISLVERVLFNDAHIDLGWVQQVLIGLVKNNWDTEYMSTDRPCECCGDYIENYKLTIKI
jgi:hypothetical protein